MTSALAGAAAALAVALGGDALAASQMFKCVEGGRTVYQQQACNPQHEPAASSPATATSAAADASSAAASKVRRPSPASSASGTPRR